jgi:hypothetical protein
MTANLTKFPLLWRRWIHKFNPAEPYKERHILLTKLPLIWLPQSSARAKISHSENSEKSYVPFLTFIFAGPRLCAWWKVCTDRSDPTLLTRAGFISIWNISYLYPKRLDDIDDEDLITWETLNKFWRQKLKNAQRNIVCDFAQQMAQAV